jgi:transcriptional regulator with XRE-family HTH domain
VALPGLAEPADIDTLIAGRLLALRQARGLSLSELAALCGVSKATVSKVERAQSSPSAAILGRLAAGLGIPLAQLLTDDAAPPTERVRRRAEQPVWRDPAQGYRRRQVAERDAAHGPEMVEIELPRGAQVHYPRWSGKPYRQRLWMVEGELRVAYGDEVYELAPGDCLDFGVDRALSFKALGGRGCRYLLVVAAG